MIHYSIVNILKTHSNYKKRPNLTDSAEELKEYYYKSESPVFDPLSVDDTNFNKHIKKYLKDKTKEDKTSSPTLPMLRSI